MNTISIKNLAQAIYDSSYEKSGDELNKVTRNAVKLISDKQMLSKAPQIIDAVMKIEDKHNKLVRAKVSYRNKLNDASLEKIKDMIKTKYDAKDVLLTLYEDSNLLGGMKIEIEDEVLDTTLKSRLVGLQNYLNKN